MAKWPGKSTRKAEQDQMRSYGELPNVKIDESRIPAPLRKLVPLAKVWSISCDDALDRAVRATSRDEITRVVHAALPLRDAIYDFAFESVGASAIPVPDEVVLFQIFVRTFEVLRFAP